VRIQRVSECAFQSQHTRGLGKVVDLPVLVLELGLLACAVVLPATLLYSRRLSFSRDCFVLFFYSQIVIYVHIAPLLCLPDVDAALHHSYVVATVASLVLFEYPLLIFYSCLARRYGASQARSQYWIDASRSRFGVFLAACTIWAIVFTVVTFRNDLVFQRIGSEALTRVLTGLPRLDFAVFRSFTVSGRVVCAITLLGILALPTRRRFLFLPGLLYGAVYTIHASLNSRSEIILLAVFLFGLVRLAPLRHRVLTNRRVRWWQVCVGGLAVIYLCSVALTIRSRPEYVPLTSPSLFIPRSSAVGSLSSAVSEAATRLNGLDLIARISPGAAATGFAWGEAWDYNIRATVFQFIDPGYANELKQTYLVSPKRYLMARYTDIRSVDYPSCMLTDLYGNFGWLGFAMGALVLGPAFFILTKSIQRPANSVQLGFGIIGLNLLLRFEAEFVVVFTGWVISLPIIGLWLLFRPLTVRHQPSLRFIRTPLQGRLFSRTIRVVSGVAASKGAKVSSDKFRPLRDLRFVRR
jgi:hypothetical protein